MSVRFCQGVESFLAWLYIICIYFHASDVYMCEWPWLYSRCQQCWKPLLITAVVSSAMFVRVDGVQKCSSMCSGEEPRSVWCSRLSRVFILSESRKQFLLWNPGLEIPCCQRCGHAGCVGNHVYSATDPDSVFIWGCLGPHQTHISVSTAFSPATLNDSFIHPPSDQFIME